MKTTKIASLEDWIERLKDSGKTVIVEGMNDKKALAFFGIKKVVTCKRRPFYIIAEKIMHEGDEAVILTDLDREGKEMYGKMKKELSRLGVKVDDSFRYYLLKETKLRQIEGLISYYKKYSIEHVRTGHHSL